MENSNDEPGSQFPRWKDKDCPHLAERQIVDGMGTICGDCGVLRVFGW